MTTQVIVHADADAVAEAVAVRLTERLAALQAELGDVRDPQLALTGGRIATKAYQRLAAEGATSAVDWSRVGLWWSDERYVPADSDDRNDRGALAALRPALPLTEANLHPMPADDGSTTVEEAAAGYAAELGDTTFDICLLGVGPDGHVASLFPDHPDGDPSIGGTVIAVHDSPKPPPLRTSVTREVLNASGEIWFTVSGADKAGAVRQSLTGEQSVPAGQVSGRSRTVWLLDEAAASELPTDLKH